MSRRAGRLAIIAAMVAKDLREFSRDRLWMILTPFSLAIFITAFWILPDSVNESMRVGLHPADLPSQVGVRGPLFLPGLDLVRFDDEDTLVKAISGELEGEEYEGMMLGLAFPSDFAEATKAGRKTTVAVYLDPAVPAELRRAISSGIREIAYALQAMAAGDQPLSALPVTLPELTTVVVGEDRLGAQVPLREKLRPLLAFVILLIEALALAGLVAIELEQRTVTALLVTPARAGDFLAAKGTTGAILGLSQGFLFLLVTQSFGDLALLVSLLMVLGAVMMSAVGLIAGALGRDFMSTLFYGMALVTPMMIPAFSVLFPGSAPLWMKALPSYGLMEAFVGSIGYGRGWAELAPELAMTAAWCVALGGLAMMVLKRKVEAL